MSVHISRINDLLKNEFDLDFVDESSVRKNEFFNIRSLRFGTYFKKICNTEILYIHSGSNILRVFHLIIGRLFLKKIILVLHGFTSQPPNFIFYLNGLVYRLANTIIAVNSTIRERLFLPENKCIVKDAFIPPFVNQEANLPESIIELIAKSKKQNRTIICANAFRLAKYNNQDLYGLDICIEVSKRLLEKQIPFTFIFVVSTIDQNAEIYFKNEALIKELQLNNHFFLINDKLSFVKIMQESDIVLRPTNTDGDSLTIREGLFLNKKVLASDVVKRPAGVRLFKNRDINDLETELEGLISNNCLIIERKNLKCYNQLNEDFKNAYSNLIQNIK